MVYELFPGSREEFQGVLFDGFKLMFLAVAGQLFRRIVRQKSFGLFVGVVESFHIFVHELMNHPALRISSHQFLGVSFELSKSVCLYVSVEGRCRSVCLCFCVLACLSD